MADGLTGGPRAEKLFNRRTLLENRGFWPKKLILEKFFWSKSLARNFAEYF
jgi:hypothetical protein